MNDRFRFRAWHEPTKKMFEVHCFTAEQVFENTLDGVGTPTNPANTDDCVLEQCTGLKDKNGKLIYEGDIVKAFFTDYLNKDYCFIGAIDWEIDRFQIYRPYFGIVFDLYDAYCDKDTGHDKNTIEVIGNIHANPELLEDVK